MTNRGTITGGAGGSGGDGLSSGNDAGGGYGVHSNGEER